MYKNIKQFKISILLEKQNKKWSPWQYLGPLVTAVVTHKTHQPPRTSSPVATRSPLVTSECQVNTDLSRASFWNTVIWVAIKTFQAHSSKRSSCWEGMHVLKWRWNPWEPRTGDGSWKPAVDPSGTRDLRVAVCGSVPSSSDLVGFQPNVWSWKGILLTSFNSRYQELWGAFETLQQRSMC